MFGVNAASPHADQANQRMGAIAAGTLGFLILATQRLAIPIGSYSMPANLVLVVILTILVFQKQSISSKLLLSYLAFCFLGGLSLLISWRASAEYSGSAASWAVVIVLYAQVILEPASQGRGGERVVWGLGKPFFAGVYLAILVGSLLGVVQFLIQDLYGRYIDPLSSLPTRYLVTGFNSHYSVYAPGGSGLITGLKPNGMIFLEPSFLSLYCGIGLAYLLGVFLELTSADGRVLGLRIWSLAVLIGGLAVSASASGVLVIGLAFVAGFMAHKRQMGRLFLVLAVSVALILSGVLDLVVAKAGEGVSGETSTALRLVLPYRVLPPSIGERLLLGWGPGGASHIVDSIGMAGLQAPTLMKVAIDYGVPALLLLSACVAIHIARSEAPTSLKVSVLAAWLLPGEALLNPALASLLIVGVGQWREPGQRAISRESLALHGLDRLRDR